VEALIGSKAEVWLFNRGHSREPIPFSGPVSRVAGDRDDAQSLVPFFSRDYDALIDLSGYRPAQIKPILERWRARIGHYLFCGTSASYQPAEVLSYGEDSSLLREPGSYGGDKALCEDSLLEASAKHSWPVTILRAHGVLGRFDPGPILYMARRIRVGEPVLLRSQAWQSRLNFVWAGDLARCFALAAGRPEASGRIFNVAGDKACLPDELAVLIRRELGEGAFLKAALSAEVAQALPALGLSWMGRDIILENARIKGALGVKFLPLEGLVANIIAWARENPGLLRLQRQRWEQQAAAGKGPPPPWLRWSWRRLDGISLG
jgi:2'-hydroxyisoflavone reductase